MGNIDKYETRKKMVYDFMCDDMYVPMKIKELCIVLGVKKEDRPQLEQILLDLQAEGRITLSKRGKYSKSEIKKTVGVFTAHQRGFGFVTVEGEPDDIFIPAEYVNGAMHMDTVEITISPVTTGRRKEGKVVSVIERGMKQVIIYTDGACSGNPGPGGWGAILKYGAHERELSGGEPSTTNNRMELLGAITALQSLREPCQVTLYTDSQYLANAINLGWLRGWKQKGWRRKEGELKNADLWQTLDALLQTHKVQFVWVKGHADNVYNNRCDALAVAQREKFA